jgi:regulator of replication initiation timing
MLKQQINNLQEQVNKRNAPPTAPAIAEEVKQLQQQNKALSDRLDALEQKVTELMKQNVELKKENDGLRKELEDKNKIIEELQKKLNVPTTPELSPEQLKERATFYQKLVDEGLTPEAIHGLKSFKDLRSSDWEKIVKGQVNLLTPNVPSGPTPTPAPTTPTPAPTTPAPSTPIAPEPERQTQKNDNAPLTDEQMKERAKQLYDQLGYFTNEDEEAIYSLLSNLSAADHRRLSDVFLKEYGEDINAYLGRDLSRSEMAIVSKLQQGSRPGTEDAVKVYNILSGWTNKGDLEQLLKGKTAEELLAMGKEYQYLFGQSFQDAIKSEFWFDSDRKPFRDAFERAQRIEDLVSKGSPAVKQAHNSLSSLQPGASIQETREWATKNQALYNSFNPNDQRDFISYIKQAYGLEESADTFTPAVFFNQKIADAAVQEIAGATTAKTITPRAYGPSMVPPTPMTVQEPDRERIGEIIDSLNDLPAVQALVRSHPDVKKLDLKDKPGDQQPPAQPLGPKKPE